jgi:uncharacterized protein (DUF1330 family)
MMKTKYMVALSALVGAAIGAIAMQGLHAQSKPPAYYVAEVDVTNLDSYTKEYAPKAAAIIKAHGGRLLAVGQNVTALDGTPPAKRVAIQQWESLEKIKAWHSSPEYKDARKIGEQYAKFRSWAVEGMSE